MSTNTTFTGLWNFKKTVAVAPSKRDNVEGNFKPVGVKE